MKKVFLGLLTISMFTACGSEQQSDNEKSGTTDSGVVDKIQEGMNEAIDTLQRKGGKLADTLKKKVVEPVKEDVKKAGERIKEAVKDAKKNIE
ncbi:MAG: hypothetical protein GXC73_01185 [Chitinophagaceae bacterium]|nr:hypothetical protein [Chitinophagaceae bacterium]